MARMTQTAPCRTGAPTGAETGMPVAVRAMRWKTARRE